MEAARERSEKGRGIHYTHVIISPERKDYTDQDLKSLIAPWTKDTKGREAAHMAVIHRDTAYPRRRRPAQVRPRRAGVGEAENRRATVGARTSDGPPPGTRAGTRRGADQAAGKRAGRGAGDGERAGARRGEAEGTMIDRLNRARAAALVRLRAHSTEARRQGALFVTRDRRRWPRLIFGWLVDQASWGMECAARRIMWGPCTTMRQAPQHPRRHRSRTSESGQQHF